METGNKLAVYKYYGTQRSPRGWRGEWFFASRSSDLEAVELRHGLHDFRVDEIVRDKVTIWRKDRK